MAGNSNFLIFDESKTNVMSDADYQSASQRQNGVLPGVADPALHNKIYRQASIMAYAIAAVMAERGETVNDSDPSGIVSAVRRAFAYSVNGDKPDQSGAIQTGKPIDAWPIGSIYISAVNTNPASMLGGGTWQRIKGTFLLAADDSAYRLGDSYGSMTKTLTESNMPKHSHSSTVSSVVAHSHTISVTNGGAHTHTASAASSGAHTHSVSGNTEGAGSHSHGRGTMNITGKFGVDDRGTWAGVDGAFTRGSAADCGAEGSDYGYVINFDASRSWTGATSEASAHKHSVNLTAASGGSHAHTITVSNGGSHGHTASATSAGAHSHTVTIGESGSGTEFDVIPKSLAVYVWRRTA